MGMREQFITNPFQRQVISFTKPSIDTIASGSPKIDMGSSYIILAARLAQGTLPVRLRLYGDETSRDLDATRTRTNPVLNDAVALSADIYLDDLSYTFDPPLIATTKNGEVYWNLSGSIVETNVELLTYPIERTSEFGQDRRRLLMTGSSITAWNRAQGNITCPKSFLILTGSANQACRVRLYSVPIEEVPPQEITRVFTTAPFSFSELIADLSMSTANFQFPLVPPLEGFTWEAANLYPTTRTMGYVIDNNNASTLSISASVYIYDLED